MNDIYSPSQASNGENNMEFQPIPLPGASGDDVPELNFNIPGLDDPSSVNHLSPDFYGSYGEEFKSADPTPMPDFSVPEINLPDSSASSDDGAMFTPVLNFSSENHEEAAVPSSSFMMPEEDLLIPDMPAPVADHTMTSKKSMVYESTVKIKNARYAEKNEKRIRRTRMEHMIFAVSMTAAEAALVFTVILKYLPSLYELISGGLRWFGGL